MSLRGLGFQTNGSFDATVSGTVGYISLRTPLLDESEERLPIVAGGVVGCVLKSFSNKDDSRFE